VRRPAKGPLRQRRWRQLKQPSLYEGHVSTLQRPLLVAPMMDWTDRRCRAFHRILTRRIRLYTELVTADAVVFGPREPR
jgi:hypothetical protein